MATATIIPPRPARIGSATRRRWRSSPMSNSRRASRPTTKKKNVIRPLFTQWRRSCATLEPPTRIVSRVCHTVSYDDPWTFTHTSAATVAASRNAALPVSVRMNSRTGDLRFRAQAVRPENGPAGSSAAFTEEGLAEWCSSARFAGRREARTQGAPIVVLSGRLRARHRGVQRSVTAQPLFRQTLLLLVALDDLRRAHRRRL